jgi:hypothetical protein
MTESQMSKLDGKFNRSERYIKVRESLLEEGYMSGWRTYVDLVNPCRLECYVPNSGPGPIVIVQQWPDEYGIEVYRPTTDDGSLDALFASIKTLRQKAVA